jgi:SSS family solute:Na+ symporter
MGEGDLAQATQDLGSMPHVIVGLYLLMLLVFGIVGYLKSTNSEEDYYLAGRGQGWLVSALTIMATFFSSFALLGAPGMVYREGLIFALFSLNVPMAGAAVYFLGSRIRKVGRAKGYVTPADMIAEYYDSPVALRLLVALIGCLYAIPYVVMQIKAGGLLADEMFPGAHSFEWGCVNLAVITMLYIMIGGMRSVAWTDVVQGLLLMGGMLVAGFATVAALGGIGGFFESVSKLPAKSLSAPGTSGRWTVGFLFSICMFASLGSMVQPAQWMRFYAARSTKTLKRSSLIFAVCLTSCFLFGIMLVGLGGQVLYPLVDSTGQYFTNEAGKMVPNPEVGANVRDYDKILVVVLKNYLPKLLPTIGTLVATIILVAIMAAAMSTADSNLHAMSAVVTRDVYDRFIRPEASDKERTWVGRGVIAGGTIISVGLVLLSKSVEESAKKGEAIDPLAMIVSLMILAIAFSSQLLPVTFDMLFFRKGSRAGAIAGILVGLGLVALFSPLVTPHLGEGLQAGIGKMGKFLDKGTWGLIANTMVFVVVTNFTRKVSQEKREEMEQILGSG